MGTMSDKRLRQAIKLAGASRKLSALREYPNRERMSMSDKAKDKCVSWEEMRKELPQEVQDRLDKARSDRLQTQDQSDKGGMRE